MTTAKIPGAGLPGTLENGLAGLPSGSHPGSVNASKVHEIGSTAVREPLAGCPTGNTSTAGQSADAARDLTDRIKTTLTRAWDLVTEAWQTRAWVALGYPSWDAYVAEEFAGTRLALPRAERPGVVASMRQASMSNRAIASATGLSEATVRRTAGASDDAPARVTGTDGKAYAAKVAAPVYRPDPATERFNRAARLADQIKEAAQALDAADLDEAMAEDGTWDRHLIAERLRAAADALDGGAR